MCPSERLAGLLSRASKRLNGAAGKVAGKASAFEKKSAVSFVAQSARMTDAGSGAGAQNPRVPACEGRG